MSENQTKQFRKWLVTYIVVCLLVAGGLIHMGFEHAEQMPVQIASSGVSE